MLRVAGPCVALCGLPHLSECCSKHVSRSDGRRQYICSSGDSRRAEADATDRDALSGFHSLGALRLPLLFARESSGTACGEERCAGSFWTNGVRGDASKPAC